MIGAIYPFVFSLKISEWMRIGLFSAVILLMASPFIPTLEDRTGIIFPNIFSLLIVGVPILLIGLFLFSWLEKDNNSKNKGDRDGR